MEGAAPPAIQTGTEGSGLTAEQVDRLRKALAYCLPVELAREHLRAIFQPEGMPCKTSGILLDEFMSFLRSGLDAPIREAYAAGRINEYKAIQGLVKRTAERLKAEGLVCPGRVRQEIPWAYTRCRKAIYRP